MIAIGADHGGYKLKEEIKKYFQEKGIEYKNFSVERTGNEQYECTQCKYIYNPKFGNEKAGIDKGTKFNDLPEDWVCPVCGEGKDMFQIHE